MKLLKLVRSLSLAAIVLGFSHSVHAEIRLPKFFGSHMVLQQEKPIIIWGWSQPNETISVELNSATVQVQANEHGEWKAILPEMKAGGPYTLTVKGSSTVQFDDVMIGEVWLCSGQSNMEMGVGQAGNAKEEIAAANHPRIRLLMVNRKFAPLPQKDIDGEWKVCSPESVAAGGWNGFSATAYYFGRNLESRLGVAVGLIDSSWGGTPIQTWTPPEGFAMVPDLKKDYDAIELADPNNPEHQRRLAVLIAETKHWLDAAEESSSIHTLVPPMPTFPADLLAPHDAQNATALYNGMIHPLVPLALRGAIWYQGEANLSDRSFYKHRMDALIGSWRKIWNEGDFPFYFVQIAPYDYGNNPDAEAEIWEAQTAAQSSTNTGMVVINDIGNLKDIHPKNKQEVGRRLALWALAKTYHQDLVYTGPTFKSASVEDDKIRITFDHAGGGLKSRDGQPLNWFEIIDAADGGFVKADAQIDGASIILSAPEVKHPAAMRFAWSMLAEPNLMNAEGLPAGAFRYGVIPTRDLLLPKVPEAKDYKLVYDLNLHKLGANITYDVDNHEQIQQPIDRIAYFLELQDEDGNNQYLYVSMHAFTNDLAKIGVPTVESGEHFQQNVTHMNVLSNVKGIVTGENLDGGNIEFWPNSYGPANGAKVPNASSESYDFGDEPSDPVNGYGSMQVHNHNASQTLFAVNHWREGKGADIGIGNQPAGQPDWTFAGNAGKWTAKRLRVLVHCK